MSVGILDYGAGNLRSVANAIRFLEKPSRIISSAAQMDDSITHLILPGVGAFGDSMNALNARNLAPLIRDWIAADRPFLGICVGYQLLFESAEESPGVEGLGIFKGNVQRFRTTEMKVPHMGWNETIPTDSNNPLFAELGEKPYFYFVHSYYPVPADQSIVSCRTTYGEPFAAGIRRGNLQAVQFHPEKSQDAGLKLLRNFVEN